MFFLKTKWILVVVIASALSSYACKDKIQEEYCEKNGSEYEIGEGYNYGCNQCGCKCNLRGEEAQWECTDCGCPEDSENNLETDSE